MPPLNNFTRSCIAIAVGQAMLGANLQAATVTVNTNLDNSITSDCTLRYALAAINNQTSGVYLGCTASLTNALGVDDEILFSLPPGQETITLNGSSLLVAEPMDINPAGLQNITIDAAGLSRVLTIAGGASNTTINEVTLTGGSTAVQGGALYMSNATSVTISNSTISGNTSIGVGGGIYVRDAIDFKLEGSSLSQNTGGIYLRSTTGAEISSSTISSNTRTGNGGGINLRNAYRTTIADSVISDNEATAGNTGGGLYVYVSNSLNLLNSLVSDNYAGDGGGVYVQSSDHAIVDRSTISNNYSLNKGGGLFAYNSKTLGVFNSTISGNSSISGSGYGGGVYLDNNSSSGEILQSTIFDNSAVEGGGVYALTNIDVSNTVIANNDSTGSSNNDCNGNVVSMDTANWISDGTCDGNIASSDPLLGPLEDNGGPTPTHAPTVGSGLNRAGDLSICTTPPIAGLDQRGETRGINACSIGAVELPDESSFFVVPTANGKSVIFEL